MLDFVPDELVMLAAAEAVPALLLAAPFVLTAAAAAVVEDVVSSVDVGGAEEVVVDRVLLLSVMRTASAELLESMSDVAEIRKLLIWPVTRSAVAVVDTVVAAMDVADAVVRVAMTPISV